MYTVKAFGVGEKGVQAGICAEIDGLSAILGFWKISRISIENTLADRMEALCLFGLEFLYKGCHRYFEFYSTMLIVRLGRAHSG